MFQEEVTLFSLENVAKQSILCLHTLELEGIFTPLFGKSKSTITTQTFKFHHKFLFYLIDAIFCVMKQKIR